MSWFKDLFIRKDSHAESIPKMPERKPEISEPVISFVETFKANPGRFSIILTEDTVFAKKGEKFWKYHYGQEPYIRLKLVDKVANLQWDFTLRTRNCFIINQYIPHPLCSYPQFLTEDEAHFLYDEIDELYENRRNRLKAIFDTKEREALKKVYCK